VQVECVLEEGEVAIDDGNHHGGVVFGRIPMEICIDSCTAGVLLRNYSLSKLFCNGRGENSEY